MDETNGAEDSLIAPKGASSLLQLFAPLASPSQQSQESTATADAAHEEVVADASNNATKSLMELFSPRVESSVASQIEQTIEAPAHDQHATDVSLENLFRQPSPTRRIANVSEGYHWSTPKSSHKNKVQEAASSALMDMFHEPLVAPISFLERSSTMPNVETNEHTSLLHARQPSLDSTTFEDFNPKHDRNGSWQASLFGDWFPPSSSAATPRTSGNARKGYIKDRSLRKMPSIHEDSPTFPPPIHQTPTFKSRIKEFCKTHLQPTTFIGASMFLLYHVVFCLAMGSAIIRPHAKTPVLGIMAKTAACGIIFASPVYVARLGGQIPAMYPTTDLFLAPFLADLAKIVDDTLAADDTMTVEDVDQVFMATFALLSGIGMTISGTLIVLASKFKLANLGSYLPYPVLCGFFSAVGLLMWSLAFKVDTNGKSVREVFGSGDSQLILHSLMHHLPSLVIAINMKWLGPKHPFFVSMLVACTILLFYVVMALTGTTLEEAKEQEWFWSSDDLVYHSDIHHIGFDRWAPPAPFGGLVSLVQGKVHWGAVSDGMSTACALSFLYLLRCSLHGTALKKNVANLSRAASVHDNVSSPSPPGRSKALLMTNRHKRRFSEVVDIEASTNPSLAHQAPEKILVRAKITNISLQDILLEYGLSQYVCAAVGSFGVTPSVAASPTMFSLGADGVAPQFGSVLLLFVLYLTDFRLVSYVPKAAFSCLIVLAFIDMTLTWFLKSFHKTKEKAEWLVVPLIVIFAFVVGLLNAVFLGIAMSTFIFVASFFRTGVVKFVACGLTVRSTIERSVNSANWLDRHGDFIQIIVLQNYLFFGNASSIHSYISTMFEDPDIDESNLDFSLPPKPKYLILDLTFVTGMDTSTVDVISDIMSLCKGFQCKVFISGLSPSIRAILALGGVKPESGERSKRNLRFFSDLDSAIGKAEDMLLALEIDEGRGESLEGRRRGRLLSEGDNGFRFALRQIDEQHGRQFAMVLLPLHEHTSPLELAPGESLFNCDGGPVQEHERGLFFIEQGIMKIERDSSVTLTRGNSNEDLGRYGATSTNSLTRMNARTGSIGRYAANLKAAGQERQSHTFRLARIGPGWIVGAIEGVSGMQNPGRHVAVSHCRLHHLPFTKVEELEGQDPVLILRLYKLLSHLMARRQEITIGQLATLHSIMTSPTQGRPIARATRTALLYSTQTTSA